MGRKVLALTTSKFLVVIGAYDSSAMLHLGQSLFPLFALALDLPETFFDDKVSLTDLVPAVGQPS